MQIPWQYACARSHIQNFLAPDDLYHIAEQCGYSDMRKFAADFKECYGVSPEEYRKQMV